MADSGDGTSRSQLLHQQPQSFCSQDASKNWPLSEGWTGFCYAGDSAAEALEDIPLCPTSAISAASVPGSASLPPDEEEERPHRLTKQRPLSAYLPFRSLRTNSQNRLPAAKKETLDDLFMPTLTGDKEGHIKVADKSKGGLSSWFSGTSAPVAVGILVESQDTEQDGLMAPTPSPKHDPSLDRVPAKLRKRPTTLPSIDVPSTTTSSRFAFFSSPKSASKTVELPPDLNDEYLNLDIRSSLFPAGSPSPQDPFSPSAFKNLLMNAEGLLLKLQTAYKLSVISLHELAAEKEAQAEELEEAETRARCLRSQLEDMAALVSEQDKAVDNLKRELAAERMARSEEKEAREKSIALIKSSREERSMLANNQWLNQTGTYGSAVHEADGPRTSQDEEGRKKWRNSNDSSGLSTEAESGNESGENDSVFSRSRSPALTCSSLGTMDSTSEFLQASLGRMVPNPNARNDRPKMVQQRPSTFQKLLKGISNSDQSPSPVDADEMRGMGLETGCNNCQGNDSSVAWDTVGLLRAENRSLKDRVGELEGAVDGALNLCAGLRL